MRFRQLEPRETRIMFGRHGVHGKDGCIPNQLTQSARKAAHDTGAEFDKAQLVISAAYSSEQPRAISTAMEICGGRGKLLPITTKKALGDTSTDPNIDIPAFKQFAADHELSIEDAIVSTNLPEELKAQIYRRAVEGAKCLRELNCTDHFGETVLAVSHGGARIEPTVMLLNNPDAKNFDELGRPEQMMRPGDVVELILCDGLLIEANYVVTAPVTV